MKRTFLAIPLAMLAAVLFCRPAHAQSYSCGGVFTCESYLDFDSSNDEVYGYSYTEDTYYGDNVVSVDASFNGGTYDDDYEYAYAEVDVDQLYADGIYYLSATHYYWGAEAGTTSALTSGYFSAPSGESTDFDGWDDADDESAMGLWTQTLSGSQNYSGLNVQETVGGTGTDTCFSQFPNDTYTPFTQITGGNWSVDDSNQWGDDNVGWFEEAVAFYRDNDAVPCSNTMYQQMQIQKGSGSWVNYGSVNTLMGYIDTTTVSSERAGYTRTRSY